MWNVIWFNWAICAIMCALVRNSGAAFGTPDESLEE